MTTEWARLTEHLAFAMRQASADAATLRQIADRYTNDDPANTFNQDAHAARLAEVANWLDSLAGVYRRSIDSLEVGR